MEAKTDTLGEISAEHNRGNYQHRKGCRVCWLIAEVVRLRQLADQALRDLHMDAPRTAEASLREALTRETVRW